MSQCVTCRGGIHDTWQVCYMQRGKNVSVCYMQRRDPRNGGDESLSVLHAEVGLHDMRREVLCNTPGA